MNSKVKKSALMASVFCVLSAALIFLLKNVDIAPVGKFGSIVGLSSVNRFFHDLFGFNTFWYKFTNYPGMIVDILVCAIFSIIGLKQWIERKNLFKVDKNLFILAGTYVASLVTYILFEKFAINCRPIILPTENVLEPSFPSSHTMWAIVVMGTAMIEFGRYIQNKKTKKIVNILIFAMILTTIIGRMASGVHWFTDILGGIFIGFALLSIYSLIINIIDSRSSIRQP